jgi:type IV secretory pathway protease TraF
MKYLLHTCLMALCLMLAGMEICSRIWWNRSASAAPVGWYISVNKKPARNDLVALNNPLKRLVGIPGDHIRVDAQGTWVNGKLLPNSAVPAGSPYRPYPFGEYVLQEDQYLFMGDNPLSYDGRYQGPVPGVEMRTVVKPW